MSEIRDWEAGINLQWTVDGMERRIVAGPVSGKDLDAIPRRESGDCAMDSTRSWTRTALAIAGALALVFATSAAAQVQTETSTASGAATHEQTITAAQVVYVNGNDVVVKMADGSLRHFNNVPDSFHVNVNGQQLGIHDLKRGMTITHTVVKTTTPQVITTTQSVTGKVWYVNPPQSVILTLADGTNQEFKVPSGQRFNVDGKMVDVWALKKGMTVSATKVVEVPQTAVSQNSTFTGTAAPPPPAPDQPILVAVETPAVRPAPAAPAAPAPVAETPKGPGAGNSHDHHAASPAGGDRSGSAGSGADGDLDEANEQRMFDDIVNRAETGAIQYHVPPTMVVNEEVSVEVDIYGAKTAEAVTGQEKLKVITPMLVLLTAPDNPQAFKIEPDPVKSGDEYLPADGKAQWVWAVTPLQGGKEAKKLKIDAYMVANAKLPSGQPMTRLIHSYTVQVPVQVSYFVVVSDFVRENWDKLLGYILPSGAGVGLIIWLLSRRNKRASEPATKG